MLVFLKIDRFGWTVTDSLNLTTTPAGTVSPSTATKAQLLAGVYLTCSTGTTHIVVTGTGVCTNFVTVPITALGNDCRVLNPIANGLRPKYGLLYNWFTASDARNIAPIGWHVPSYAEWTTLRDYLGGQSIAGKHLKETGLTYWDSDQFADNSSSFSGRGIGTRAYNSGAFGGLKMSSRFWNTWNVGDPYYSLVYEMTYNSDILSNLTSDKNQGHPIRFVKDNTSDTGIMTGNGGIIYRTVKIGSQVWTAENSAETLFRDGSVIPEVTGDAAWIALSTPALCAVDNNWNNV